MIMSIPHRDIFKKHSHLDHFIETGTCLGRSVQIALELGFKHIQSVEADRYRYDRCAELFRNASNVRLWHGESVPVLPEMINGLTEPALFWLDAHPSGAGSYGDKNFLDDPKRFGQQGILESELKIIEKHPLKNHVILVDDLTPEVDRFARSLFAGRKFCVYPTEEENGLVLEII